MAITFHVSCSRTLLTQRLFETSVMTKSFTYTLDHPSHTQARFPTRSGSSRRFRRFFCSTTSSKVRDSGQNMKTRMLSTRCPSTITLSRFFDFSRSLFAGELPESIGQLTALEKLWLHSNNFSGTGFWTELEDKDATHAASLLGTGSSTHFSNSYNTAPIAARAHRRASRLDRELVGAADFSATQQPVRRYGVLHRT